MTDNNRFFIYLWRVNALFIFGIAVLVALFVGAQALRELRQALRTPPAPPPVVAEAVQDTPAGSERLFLGEFRRVSGSVFRADLRTERDNYAISGKSGSGIVRNVLFYDAADGRMRRLFGNDIGLVVGDQAIIREGNRDQVLARVYSYVAADSNGNGRIDHQDRRRIVITKPDGTGPMILADDVESFESEFTPSGDVLSYFVRKSGELRYFEFDLGIFAPKREAPVAVPKLGG